MFGNSKVVHLEKLVSELQDELETKKIEVEEMRESLANASEVLDLIKTKELDHFNKVLEVFEQASCEHLDDARLDSSGDGSLHYAFKTKDRWVTFFMHKADFCSYSILKRIGKAPNQEVVLDREFRFDISIPEVSDKVYEWFKDIIKKEYDLEVIPYVGGDSENSSYFSSRSFFSTIKDDADEFELSSQYRKQVDYLQAVWESKKALQHFKRESAKLISAAKELPVQAREELPFVQPIVFSEKLESAFKKLQEREEERRSKLPDYLRNLEDLFKELPIKFDSKKFNEVEEIIKKFEEIIKQKSQIPA